jgi:hypothetical protein
LEPPSVEYADATDEVDPAMSLPRTGSNNKIFHPVDDGKAPPETQLEPPSVEYADAVPPFAIVTNL